MKDVLARNPHCEIRTHRHLGEGKLRFQTSAALRPYPGMAKASGVNPKEKSEVGVPKPVRGCIQSRRGNSCDVVETKCIGSCLSIGPIQRRGEGGVAAWVTVYPPYLPTQATRTVEATPSLLTQLWHNTGSSGLPAISLLLDWQRARRQGLLPTVREVIAPHRAATAHLKLGKPQPVKCCLATVR